MAIYLKENHAFKSIGNPNCFLQATVEASMLRIVHVTRPNTLHQPHRRTGAAGAWSEPAESRCYIHRLSPAL